MRTKEEILQGLLKELAKTKNDEAINNEIQYRILTVLIDIRDILAKPPEELKEVCIECGSDEDISEGQCVDCRTANPQ